MHRIRIDADFEAWRVAARQALADGFTPEQIDFQDATVPSSLALDLSADQRPSGEPVTNPHVPQTSFQTAGVAAAHRSPHRWNLLYRLLYRLQSRRDLLRVEVDDDVA